jgi:hypothetical protein
MASVADLRGAPFLRGAPGRARTVSRPGAWRDAPVATAASPGRLRPGARSAALWRALRSPQRSLLLRVGPVPRGRTVPDRASRPGGHRVMRRSVSAAADSTAELYFCQVLGSISARSRLTIRPGKAHAKSSIRAGYARQSHPAHCRLAAHHWSRRDQPQHMSFASKSVLGGEHLLGWMHQAAIVLAVIHGLPLQAFGFDDPGTIYAICRGLQGRLSARHSPSSSPRRELRSEGRSVSVGLASQLRVSRGT